MHILYAVLVLLMAGGLASLFLGRIRHALTTASGASVLGSLLGLNLALGVFLEGSTLSGYLPCPWGTASSRLIRCRRLFSCRSSCFPPSAARCCLRASGRLRKARPSPSATAGTAFLLYAHRGHGAGADHLRCRLFSYRVGNHVPVAFFPISPQDRDSKERFATWIYLVAAHLDVLPLLLLFASMSVEAGSGAFAALYAPLMAGGAPVCSLRSPFWALV